MIIKTCRNGHDLTADMIHKDGKCKVCRGLLREKQKRSGKYKEYQANYLANMTEEQRERRLETKRAWLKKNPRKRDYQHERASRLGLTREEYIESIDDRKSRIEIGRARREVLQVFSAVSKLKEDHLFCSSHVDLWKRVSRDLKIKSYFIWEFQQKKKNLLPCYVAKKLGGRVADYPAPLIDLKRQLIITWRYLRELK